MSDLIFSELPGKQSNIGEIILNRPQALNALSHEMIQALRAQLAHWATSAHIRAVIIRSNIDKAFCAGGDIRQVYDYRQRNPQLAQQYFADEYQLNFQIAHYPKPYIAFLNGITMGGGAGVSIHGSYRIAVENLRFAMPETGIGFFPDVGASYFLARCPHHIGLYLGLTGVTINAADAVYIQLVDSTITQNALPTIIALLQDAATLDVSSCSRLLADFKPANGNSALQQYQTLIVQHFSKASIAEIIASLQKDMQPWSQQTLAVLQAKSPTSLKVTFEQLKRAKTLALSDCLKMDFYLTQQFLAGNEFYEGIRAAVIEKDRSPQWQPAQLKDISSALLNRFFLWQEKLELQLPNQT